MSVQIPPKCSKRPPSMKPTQQINTDAYQTETYAQDVFWQLLESTCGYQKPRFYSFNDSFASAAQINRTRSLRAKRMALGGIIDPLEEEERETKEGQAAVILDIAKFEQKLALNKASVAGGLDWMGREEAKLMGKLPPDLTGEEVIHCFETLRMPRMKIEHLDLENFQRLRELDVSGNNLGRIDGIPWSLQILNAYDCQIDEVGNLPEGLLHLGLGYNKQHSNQQIDSIVAMCPGLISLDLSYNSLCDFKAALTSVKLLKSLKHLYFAGNPLALARNYRLWVLKTLEGLEVFDDIAINPNKIEDVPAGVQLASEIKINVALESIEGIRKPSALEGVEGGGEDTAPNITYQYYATVTSPASSEQQSTNKIKWAPIMKTHWAQQAVILPTSTLRDGLLFSGIDIDVYEEVITVPDAIDAMDAQSPAGIDTENGQPPQVNKVGAVHIDLDFMLDPKTTDNGNLASYSERICLELVDAFRPTESVPEPQEVTTDKKKGKGKGKGKQTGDDEEEAPAQPAGVHFTFCINALEPEADAVEEEQADASSAKGKKGKKK